MWCQLHKNFCLTRSTIIKCDAKLTIIVHLTKATLITWCQVHKNFSSDIAHPYHVMHVPPELLLNKVLPPHQVIQVHKIYLFPKVNPHQSSWLATFERARLVVGRWNQDSYDVTIMQLECHLIRSQSQSNLLILSWDFVGNDPSLELFWLAVHALP